jgi:hypothetical protein
MPDSPADPVAAYRQIAERNLAEMRAVVIAAQARLDQVDALYHDVMHVPWGCICPPDPAAPYAACPVHCTDPGAFHAFRTALLGETGQSLGEQPHDAAHCHLGGRPHPGPCTDPEGGTDG